MEHLHHDLGFLPAGAVVTVHLTAAANVQLLDETNYRSYQRLGGFRYVGGHYTQTPIRLRTPSSGHWHVAVDLGGRAGRVGAQVSVAA